MLNSRYTVCDRVQLGKIFWPSWNERGQRFTPRDGATLRKQACAASGTLQFYVSRVHFNLAPLIMPERISHRVHRNALGLVLRIIGSTRARNRACRKVAGDKCAAPRNRERERPPTRAGICLSARKEASATRIYISKMQNRLLKFSFDEKEYDGVHARVSHVSSKSFTIQLRVS